MQMGSVYDRREFIFQVSFILPHSVCVLDGCGDDLGIVENIFSSLNSVVRTALTPTPLPLWERGF
jgi:hypothetical protein